MKKTLLISPLVLFLFSLSLSVIAQTDTLPKRTVKSEYYFTDIPVTVYNGHEDSINVLFSAAIDTTLWQKYVATQKNNERDAFSAVAMYLSLSAKYTLNNKLSFEPFKKQFFSGKKKTFECLYKMSGKNGFGNDVEGSEIVYYKMKL